MDSEVEQAMVWLHAMAWMEVTVEGTVAGTVATSAVPAPYVNAPAPEPPIQL
jgi:hypothetical protein